jgi:hypothetical protein
MSQSEQMLSAGIDDDFAKVIEDLQQLFVMAAKLNRGRATHTYGTAARGRATIIVPPGFPENEFLTAGKTYPIVLRHAKPGVSQDDRTLDGAATSIKFLDESNSVDGFHDVMMNTGNVLFVKSAREFNTMVHILPNRELSGQAMRDDYVARRKQLVTDGVVQDDKLTQGYRTGSFTEFYYHSQMCYEFNDKYYMRYRMIPGDRGLERGFLPPSIRAGGRTTDPSWDDDRRASDHMRRDFDLRATHLGVSYILQVQLRPADVFEDPWATQVEQNRINEGLEPSALNASEYWDVRYYPWIDMARLDVGNVLTLDELDILSFDANRTHSTINLPLVTHPLAPKNPRDPRKQADQWASFGHSRALVYWLARKARAEAGAPHNN